MNMTQCVSVSSSVRSGMLKTSVSVLILSLSFGCSDPATTAERSQQTRDHIRAPKINATAAAQLAQQSKAAAAPTQATTPELIATTTTTVSEVSQPMGPMGEPPQVAAFGGCDPVVCNPVDPDNALCAACLLEADDSVPGFPVTNLFEDGELWQSFYPFSYLSFAWDDPVCVNQVALESFPDNPGTPDDDESESSVKDLVVLVTDPNVGGDNFLLGWTALEVPAIAATENHASLLEGGRVAAIENQETTGEGINVLDGTNLSFWTSDPNDSASITVGFDSNWDKNVASDDDGVAVSEIRLTNPDYDQTDAEPDDGAKRFTLEVDTGSGFQYVPVPGSVAGEADYDFAHDVAGAEVASSTGTLDDSSDLLIDGITGQPQNFWRAASAGYKMPAIATLEFDTDNDGVTGGPGGDVSDEFTLQKFRLVQPNSDIGVRYFSVEVGTKASDDYVKLTDPTIEPLDHAAPYGHLGNGAQIYDSSFEYDDIIRSSRNLLDGNPKTPWIAPLVGVDEYGNAGSAYARVEFDFDGDGVGSIAKTEGADLLHPTGFSLKAGLGSAAVKRFVVGYSPYYHWSNGNGNNGWDEKYLPNLSAPLENDEYNYAAYYNGAQHVQQVDFGFDRSLSDGVMAAAGLVNTLGPQVWAFNPNFGDSQSEESHQSSSSYEGDPQDAFQLDKIRQWGPTDGTNTYGFTVRAWQINNVMSFPDGGTPIAVPGASAGDSGTILSLRANGGMIRASSYQSDDHDHGDWATLSPDRAVDHDGNTTWAASDMDAQPYFMVGMDSNGDGVAGTFAENEMDPSTDTNEHFVWEGLFLHAGGGWGQHNTDAAFSISYVTTDSVDDPDPYLPLVNPDAPDVRHPGLQSSSFGGSAWWASCETNGSNAIDSIDGDAESSLMCTDGYEPVEVIYALGEGHPETQLGSFSWEMPGMNLSAVALSSYDGEDYQPVVVDTNREGAIWNTEHEQGKLSNFPQQENGGVYSSTHAFDGHRRPTNTWGVTDAFLPASIEFTWDPDLDSQDAKAGDSDDVMGELSGIAAYGPGGTQTLGAFTVDYAEAAAPNTWLPLPNPQSGPGYMHDPNFNYASRAEGGYTTNPLHPAYNDGSFATKQSMNTQTANFDFQFAPHGTVGPAVVPVHSIGICQEPGAPHALTTFKVFVKSPDFGDPDAWEEQTDQGGNAVWTADPSHNGTCEVIGLQTPVGNATDVRVATLTTSSGTNLELNDIQVLGANTTQSRVFNMPEHNDNAYEWGIPAGVEDVVAVRFTVLDKKHDTNNAAAYDHTRTLVTEFEVIGDKVNQNAYVWDFSDGEDQQWVLPTPLAADRPFQLTFIDWDHGADFMLTELIANPATNPSNLWDFPANPDFPGEGVHATIPLSYTLPAPIANVLEVRIEPHPNGLPSAEYYTMPAFTEIHVIGQSKFPSRIFRPGAGGNGVVNGLATTWDLLASSLEHEQTALVQMVPFGGQNLVGAPKIYEFGLLGSSEIPNSPGEYYPSHEFTVAGAGEAVEVTGLEDYTEFSETLTLRPIETFGSSDVSVADFIVHGKANFSNKVFDATTLFGDGTVTLSSAVADVNKARLLAYGPAGDEAEMRVEELQMLGPSVGPSRIHTATQSGTTTVPYSGTDVRRLRVGLIDNYGGEDRCLGDIAVVGDMTNGNHTVTVPQNTGGGFTVDLVDPPDTATLSMMTVSNYGGLTTGLASLSAGFDAGGASCSANEGPAVLITELSDPDDPVDLDANGTDQLMVRATLTATETAISDVGVSISVDSFEDASEFVKKVHLHRVDGEVIEGTTSSDEFPFAAAGSLITLQLPLGALPFGNPDGDDVEVAVTFDLERAPAGTSVAASIVPFGFGGSSALGPPIAVGIADGEYLPVIDDEAPVVTAGGLIQREVDTENGNVLNVETEVGVGLAVSDDVDDLNTSNVVARLGAVDGAMITGAYSFSFGTSIVYWVASDSAGNVGFATQEVRIVDTQPPEIKLDEGYLYVEADIEATPDGTGWGTPVDLPIPQLEDNYDVNPTYTIVGPDLFPTIQNQISVRYEATDSSGNASELHFYVQIADSTRPVFDEGVIDPDNPIGYRYVLPTASIPFTGSAPIVPFPRVSDNGFPEDEIEVGYTYAVDKASCVSADFMDDPPVTEGTFFACWSAEDGFGNWAFAAQQIDVATLDPDDVIAVDQRLECDGSVVAQGASYNCNRLTLVTAAAAGCTTDCPTLPMTVSAQATTLYGTQVSPDGVETVGSETHVHFTENLTYNTITSLVTDNAGGSAVGATFSAGIDRSAPTVDMAGSEFEIDEFLPFGMPFMMMAFSDENTLFSLDGFQPRLYYGESFDASGMMGAADVNGAGIKSMSVVVDPDIGQIGARYLEFVGDDDDVVTVPTNGLELDGDFGVEVWIKQTDFDRAQSDTMTLFVAGDILEGFDGAGDDAKGWNVPTWQESDCVNTDYAHSDGDGPGGMDGPEPPPGSCDGRCGEASSPPDVMCGCDMACQDREDCCADAQSLCAPSGPLGEDSHETEGISEWFGFTGPAGAGDPQGPMSEPDPNSCQDRCGTGVPEGGSCACNEDCFDDGNCCADMFDVCMAEHGDSGNTCKDRCGEESTLSACGCDENCEDRDDCCEDLTNECGYSSSQYHYSDYSAPVRPKGVALGIVEGRLQFMASDGTTTVVLHHCLYAEGDDPANDPWKRGWDQVKVIRRHVFSEDGSAMVWEMNSSSDNYSHDGWDSLTTGVFDVPVPDTLYIGNDSNNTTPTTMAIDSIAFHRVAPSHSDFHDRAITGTPPVVGPNLSLALNFDRTSQTVVDDARPTFPGQLGYHGNIETADPTRRQDDSYNGKTEVLIAHFDFPAAVDGDGFLTGPDAVGSLNPADATVYTCNQGTSLCPNGDTTVEWGALMDLDDGEPKIHTLMVMAEDYAGNIGTSSMPIVISTLENTLEEHLVMYNFILNENASGPSMAEYIGNPVNEAIGHANAALAYMNLTSDDGDPVSFRLAPIMEARKILELYANDILPIMPLQMAGIFLYFAMDLARATVGEAQLLMRDVEGQSDAFAGASDDDLLGNLSADGYSTTAASHLSDISTLMASADGFSAYQTFIANSYFFDVLDDALLAAQKVTPVTPAFGDFRDKWADAADNFEPTAFDDDGNAVATPEVSAYVQAMSPMLESQVTDRIEALLSVPGQAESAKIQQIYDFVIGADPQLDVGLTDCAADLANFGLNDTDFLGCYIAEALIATQMTSLNQSLVDFTAIKTALAYQLLGFLSTSLYLSPTSIKFIIRAANGGVDPTPAEMAATYPDYLASMTTFNTLRDDFRDGKIDDVLQGFRTNACSVIDSFNRYYSTDSVAAIGLAAIDNPSKDPDSLLLDDPYDGTWVGCP